MDADSPAGRKPRPPLTLPPPQRITYAMPFETLTDDETRIVFACLCAYVKGPFVDPDDIIFVMDLSADRQFKHVGQDVYLKAIEQWPSPSGKRAAQAVYNSLTVAAHGTEPPWGVLEDDWERRFPRISDADWGVWFSVDRDAVKRLYEKWRGLMEANETET